MALILDDDLFFCELVAEYLKELGLEVVLAHTAAEGLRVCASRNIDIVLLDQRLPDGSGKDLCPPILSFNDQTKIIFTTAHPSFQNAVDAIKLGAHDYLTKPFKLDELGLAVRKALKTIDLEKFKQAQTYRNSLEVNNFLLIGRDGGLAATDRLVELAAQNNVAVLITGETGVGKSLIAKAVHYRSAAHSAPYLSINCAALPENLIEAELFGHEKGAFSGAVSAKKGIFEMAEGGSLCLEEVGDLPIHLQSKLLGVLDDKKIKRIGGQSLRPIDVRIIAATNRDLESSVSVKMFREDLFYRLCVLRIHVPPLRQRLADIPELCRHFIHQMAPNLNPNLPEDEIRWLMDYHWPGNVRELRNVIERSIILRSGGGIRPSALVHRQKPRETDRPQEQDASPVSGFSLPHGEGPMSMAQVEKRYITYLLERLDRNHTRTARALGFSRSTLMRKIRQYGL